MKLRGWITIRTPAARGRVTVHGVDIARILDDTRGVWPAVGPDYEARMDGGAEVQDASNVVPFSRAGTAPANDGTLWSAVSARLWQEDAAVHSAWFARLVEAGRTADTLTLAAPSTFVASYVAANLSGLLLRAAAAEEPGIRRVKVIAG